MMGVFMSVGGGPRGHRLDMGIVMQAFAWLLRVPWELPKGVLT